MIKKQMIQMIHESVLTNEPMFLIRGSDAFAEEIVSNYVEKLKNDPQTETDFLSAVRMELRDISAWRVLARDQIMLPCYQLYKHR